MAEDPPGVPGQQERGHGRDHDEEDDADPGQAGTKPVAPAALYAHNRQDRGAARAIRPRRVHEVGGPGRR